MYLLINSFFPYLCRENVGTTYSAQMIPTFSKAKANDTHVFKVNPPFHQQLGYFADTVVEDTQISEYKAGNSKYKAGIGQKSGGQK